MKIDEMKQEHFQPKWFLNGFPKSGLHWLELMLMPVAKPQSKEHEIWSEPWAGTFRLNSWSTVEAPMERVTYKIGRLMDQHFIKSHSAYSEDLERFLWLLGVAHVFIYRDFRDVAVSQAFHVLAEDDTRWMHPNKDYYRSLSSFEDVLEAVILGITDDQGREFPGVMERWGYYAGWLDVDWVCKLRFEDLKEDTHEAAKKILRHGLSRACNIYGLEPQIVNENVDMVADMMVEAGNMTQHSITFRRGATGDWRDYFTSKLAWQFSETDEDNWLIKLGYAEEEWWRQ